MRVIHRWWVIHSCFCLGSAGFVVSCLAAAVKVMRLFPRIYVDARDYEADPVGVGRRAAARYLGSAGALSHATALDLWELRRQPPGDPIHATVDRGCRLRASNGLVIHHRTGFADAKRTWRHGLPVVPASWAVVDSWPMLSRIEQRSVTIEAVNRRLATPSGLLDLLRARPKLLGAKAFRALLRLLEAGCRSHLEIWGVVHVFSGPDMPRFTRQHPVRVGGREIFLDVYQEQARVAFELDGAAFHGSREQRERDIRRDALLATVGIQVVRFSYQRLVSDPASVRREVRAILAARSRAPISGSGSQNAAEKGSRSWQA